MAWVLGAGGVAVAAGILYANMDWWKSVPKADMDYLNSIKLKKLDGSDNEIDALQLWRKTGAVVMVVRRPG